MGVTAVWSWPYSFRFSSVGMDEKRSLQRKNKHKRRIGRSHYEHCCSHKARTPRRPPGEQHVLLPTELKSASKSMVGFVNTYFELLQFIEIIYMNNKCNQ